MHAYGGIHAQAQADSPALGVFIKILKAGGAGDLISDDLLIRIRDEETNVEIADLCTAAVRGPCRRGVRPMPAWPRHGRRPGGPHEGVRAVGWRTCHAYAQRRLHKCRPPRASSVGPQVDVWRSVPRPLDEAPRQEWLQSYLGSDARKGIYKAWSKADRVWAVLRYFSWKELDPDAPTSLEVALGILVNQVRVHACMRGGRAGGRCGTAS